MSNKNNQVLLSTQVEQADIRAWDLPYWGEKFPEKPAVSEAVVEEILLPTADEVEKIREDAYREGFEQGLAEGRDQGHAEGLKEGKEESKNKGLRQSLEEGQALEFDQDIKNGEQAIKEAVERFQGLCKKLQAPIDGQEEAMMGALAKLIEQAVTQVVRAQPVLGGEALKTLVKEAVSSQPIGAEHMQLWLHSKDLAELERYGQEFHDLC